MGYGFHSKNGLFFERDADGNVVIRKVAFVGNRVMSKVTLDENTWASAVASVCAKGEDANTFHKALNFHQFGRLEPPTAI